MLMNMNDVANNLLYSTVRLEATLPDGSKKTGTGFFFRFMCDERVSIPAVVTNVHVIDKSEHCDFFLHLADQNGSGGVQYDEGASPSGKSAWVQVQTSDLTWVRHPKYDICAMPLGSILHAAEKDKKTVFYRPFSNGSIKDQETLANLTALEDVLMIGYPNGLWDEVHNLPLVRRGITATHPAVDFNGKSEGVVDIGVYGGSSGSPILIWNQGALVGDGDKVNLVKRRCILLGVLYAGPVMRAEGEIKVREIPTSNEVYSETVSTIHLGYYVKAVNLLDLGRQLDALPGLLSEDRQTGS